MAFFAFPVSSDRSRWEVFSTKEHNNFIGVLHKLECYNIKYKIFIYIKEI